VSTLSGQAIEHAGRSGLLCSPSAASAADTLRRVKVMVLGSGAREHALLLGLSRDPSVTGLVCAPGNAGTAALAESRSVDTSDGGAVVALARDVAADLVVVGPEVPLVAGVADALREAGIACFGPSAAAARIEGSKSFAKQVMRDAGVATAAAELFTDPAACASYLAGVPAPYVVKADGLAAGKGVHVGSDLAVAQAFAATCCPRPGRPSWWRPTSTGPEVSLFALSDGRTVVPLLPAQDFKRVGDGDSGPNTGGMGAYAPLPVAAGRHGRAGAPPGARAGRRRDVAPRDAVRRPALRRAGDDSDRPAGHRVQLPLRRP
jgi:phosphoribosylamine--glycine ligase